MRRKDREVTDFEEIIEIIRKCDVCRLGLQDEEAPYIVPLNFGMQLENEKLVFYFHGALEGKKYKLLEKNNKVSFEMDCSHRLVIEEDTNNCTMEYESVMGHGVVEFLQEEEKKEALKVLMKQYHKEELAFNEAVMSHTNVFKLTVSDYTGKKKMVSK